MRFVAEKLNGGSFLALKNLELLFAYDLELNCLRIRATNHKHILSSCRARKWGTASRSSTKPHRTIIGPCRPTWSLRITCGS